MQRQRPGRRLKTQRDPTGLEHDAVLVVQDGHEDARPARLIVIAPVDIEEIRVR
jgi:hypothetical protein